jgi:hypothetical protein
VHAASHLPVHVPLHMPPLWLVPLHWPLQLPMQVPSQSIEPALGGVHVPVHSAEHEPWQLACAVTDPSHVAIAMHMPLHWPVSSPGLQRAVTLPGWQEPDALHVPSQLTCALALTVHWPPEIDSPHAAEAPASPLRPAEIALAAWLQASVTSASSEPPASGPFAVHVSVTIRSESMPMHAESTSPSIVCAMVTSSEAAVTNALVLPSIDRLATDDAPPLNSLHPDARPWALLNALQPPLPRAIAPMAPAITKPGTNLKALRWVMKSSPFETEARVATNTPRLDRRASLAAHAILPPSAPRSILKAEGLRDAFDRARCAQELAVHREPTLCNAWQDPMAAPSVSPRAARWSTWTRAGVLAASGAVACGGGSGAAGGDGGSALQSSGHDANPYGVAYPPAPAGGYGHTARSGGTPGSVIQNFKFRGYAGGVVPAGGAMGVVSLADYFDPCGKTYKMIRLSAAAVWCGPCNQETDAYVAARADLASKGVVVLQFLFEGPAVGTAATQPILVDWAHQHASNLTEMLDPELADPDLGGFFQRDAIPWNADIDARTMEILTSTEGFGGSVDAELAPGLAAIASPPLYPVTAHCP